MQFNETLKEYYENIQNLSFYYEQVRYILNYLGEGNKGNLASSDILLSLILTILSTITSTITEILFLSSKTLLLLFLLSISSPIIYFERFVKYSNLLEALELVPIMFSYAEN